MMRRRRAREFSVQKSRGASDGEDGMGGQGRRMIAAPRIDLCPQPRTLEAEKIRASSTATRSADGTEALARVRSSARSASSHVTTASEAAERRAASRTSRGPVLNPRARGTVKNHRGRGASSSRSARRTMGPGEHHARTERRGRAGAELNQIRTSREMSLICGRTVRDGRQSGGSGWAGCTSAA